MNKVLLQAYEDYNGDIARVVQQKIDIFDAQNISLEEQSQADETQGMDIEQACSFLLALNSVNYQYWDVVNGQFIRYQHNSKIGAMASFEGFLALYEQIQNGRLKPHEISGTIIAQYYGNIPDIEGRVSILKESLNKNKVKKAFDLINTSVIEKGIIDVDLAQEVAQVLPLSFNDEYLKKIQLSLYEIANVYKSHGHKVDCSITVAADYQIPKVLEGMGIIEYCPWLSKKIDAMQIIEPGSQEERAIRAATIIACDKISKQHTISIAVLDRALWLARNEFKDKKFHLTKTRKY